MEYEIDHLPDNSFCVARSMLYEDWLSCHEWIAKTPELWRDIVIVRKERECCLDDGPETTVYEVRSPERWKQIYQNLLDNPEPENMRPLRDYVIDFHIVGESSYLLFKLKWD